MSQENKYDGIFMSVIQQTGNIDSFFDSVFGFLRRNTDFFANQKKAEQIIVNSCKKNFELFTATEAEKKKQQQKKKLAQQKRKLQREQLKKKTQVQSNPPAQKNPINTTIKEQSTKKQSSQQKEEAAPVQNGGRTEKYIWTQTLENLDMYVFLNQNVNSKQVKVNIGLDTLKIVVNGQSMIDGKLKQKINSEDSIWTIENGQIHDYKGRYIHLSIQKWKNQTSWWSTPIQGDKQINTQKINPQPSKLSDLDGETRSTVEKMMFDMKQKQQGLPSSDELQKQDKMKQFMKSHPELDFSQCKFN